MTDDFEPMSPSDEAHDPGPTGPATAPVAGSAAASRGPARRIVLAIVLVLAIAVLAFAGLRANTLWNRHAMVEVGAIAAQALIEGKADALSAVSNEAVRSGLTTATVATMKATGVLGEFSAPGWSGDEATITVTTGMGVGELKVAPAPDGADVVTFQTDGAIGKATGALRMERTGSGWVVAGLTVVPITKPASHPTAPTTATPVP